MPPAHRSPLVNVMVGAARKAAKTLLRDFTEVERLQVVAKGASDFVSQADLLAEETLRTELSRARPDFGWLMEEGGVGGKADWDHRYGGEQMWTSPKNQVIGSGSNPLLLGRPHVTTKAEGSLDQRAAQITVIQIGSAVAAR